MSISSVLLSVGIATIATVLALIPGTSELEHVPIKDVIVGEALHVEKIAENLAEVAEKNEP